MVEFLLNLVDIYDYVNLANVLIVISLAYTCRYDYCIYAKKKNQYISSFPIFIMITPLLVTAFLTIYLIKVDISAAMALEELSRNSSPNAVVSQWGQLPTTPRISSNFFQTLIIILGSLFSYTLKVILDNHRDKEKVLMIKYFVLFITFWGIIVLLVLFQYSDLISTFVWSRVDGLYTFILSLFYAWCLMTLCSIFIYVSIWNHNNSNTLNEGSS